jgi:hypothetical protein
MATEVAVVSKPLADRLFPGTEPIGERVTVTLEEGREQAFTIIGVSADFATSQLTTERPQILLPLPEALPSTVFLIARGAPGDEPKLKGALQNGLRELRVDAVPGEVFAGVVTGQDLVQKSLADLVSESTAVAVAGGLVLVLAALGIVGVVGFMVATRTREIAVRIALGCTRGRVFGLMLSDIVKLAIPGVVGGLLLAAVLIRSMEDVMGTPLTLGPTPLGVMEPLIYALAATIAVSAALLAGLPAVRRATSFSRWSRYDRSSVAKVLLVLALAAVVLVLLWGLQRNMRLRQYHVDRAALSGWTWFSARLRTRGWSPSSRPLADDESPRAGEDQRRSPVRRAAPRGAAAGHAPGARRGAAGCVRPGDIERMARQTIAGESTFEPVCIGHRVDPHRRRVGRALFPRLSPRPRSTHFAWSSSLIFPNTPASASTARVR